MRLSHAFSVLAIGGILLFAAPVTASPELRKELAEAAKSIKQLLDGHNESDIAVGQFSGPANFPTSSGPGIAQTLTEEFQKLGITVKKRAKYGIKGEYMATEIPSAENPRAKMLAIKLKGTVEDSFGKVITDFSFDRTISGENTFVDLMGMPADLPPGETPEKRDKIIREALAKPQTSTKGSRIAAGPTSKYAIEILVADKARTPTDDDGLAYVKIDRGETYAVRLINDSDLEAAVQLSIDGLSMFTFSELKFKDGPKKGEPQYSVLILKPRSQTTVLGWHRTNDRSDSFLVTEYAKSAAATINHTANLGTITATFAAAWPADENPPKDEPPKKKGIGLGDGTGFGPPVEAKFTEIRRNVGAIRASVSARYTK